MDPKLKNLLSLFDLKDMEMEIFERMLENGTASASGLARQAHITRTSVYDYLEHLKEKGLVSQTIMNGMRMFSAEEPEKIELLLTEHEKKIVSARGALAILKESHGKQEKNIRPRLQMFEGRSALQQMMKDMLLYDNITVSAYWPILNVIKLLTPEFLEKFHEERVRQNITLRTIWPHNQIPSVKKYYFLALGQEKKREVRLAPKGIDFDLGYAIYENTVRFISSSRENFSYLIASRELTNTMRGQFDAVWKISKKLNKTR